MASSEDRARLPRGLPETIRTRSWLFIRLYLFSDLLTNWGQRGGRGDGLPRLRRPPLRSQLCLVLRGCEKLLNLSGLPLSS